MLIEVSLKTRIPTDGAREVSLLKAESYPNSRRARICELEASCKRFGVVGEAFLRDESWCRGQEMHARLQEKLVAADLGFTGFVCRSELGGKHKMSVGTAS